MAEINILNEVPEMNYSEVSDYKNPEEFTKLVNNRRSCRVFTEEQIPEEIMQKCLDLALLAPNSSNLQPWAFYWVKSAEKRKSLNYFCLNQLAAKTAAEIIVVVANPEMWKTTRQLMLDELGKNKNVKSVASALSYYKKLVPLAYNQGPLNLLGFIKKIAVFFIGLKKPTPRKPTSNAQMKTWAQKSTALACENLMLAFRAYGYDTCPMEGLDDKRIADMLNLKGNAEVCMAIAVGKRAANGIYGPRIRFNRDLFIKKV